MQVQQQERQAWQAFCMASVRVVPSEAAAPAMGGGKQEGQGGLYQQRLPQLATTMQRLLSEAGLAGLHAPGELGLIR